MKPRLRRTAYVALVSGAAVLGAAPAANSGTLNDNYWGGIDTLTPSGGDVIGPSLFNITSADITRINNGQILQVTIYTAYAGAPGSPAADGTNYGSLFFAPTWNPAGLAPYSTDVYQPNEWTKAFVTTSSTTGGLYSTGQVQTKNDYFNNGTDTGVAQSYTTTTGTIVMSNVHGDPVTYPTPGNPGFYFRQGQAVRFDPTAPQLDGGSWSVNPGVSITYLINDSGSLGNSFAMSWAMDCANDVIQGWVSVPGPIAGAGFPGALLATGGLLALWRTRQRKSSSTARFS